MQPFDEKELLDRVDHDWEFLADTVQMLETDGRELMAEIRRAADASDAPPRYNCSSQLYLPLPRW